MVFRKYTPAPPLNSYIDCIVYIEGNNKGAGFPKTAMSLVFNLNDSFKLFTDRQFTHFADYNKYWIAGFQTRPSYVESYGESKMIVIQFRTAGAYAFLQQPLHYFADHYVDLDCVFNHEAEETWCRLKESDTLQEKFAVAENFLLRKLRRTGRPHFKLASSMNTLFAGNENISIKDVCRQHTISRKHLNFLFREFIGVSPKMMSSLHRFQSILQVITKTNPGKLSAVAYELDYFDQAHFSNQFKRFTGLQPNEYMKNVAQIPSLRIVPHFFPAG